MLSPEDRWLDELVTPCFDCGQGAMHQHHVVPRSLGGTKTVPLCEECHRKVHDRETGTSRVAHVALTRAGIAKARANGKRLGAKPYALVRPEIAQDVRTLYSTGAYTHASLAAELNARGTPALRTGARWHATTVARVLRQLAS